MQHHPIPRARPPAVLILAVVGLALAPIAVCSAWAWVQWSVLEETQPALAAAIRVAYTVLPFVLVSGAAILGGTIALRRWASAELLKADRVVALTKARQMFPEGLQTLSFHDSHKELPAPPIEAPALPAPELPGIPTFAQLLDQGQIGPGRALCLGYDAETGAPIAGSWGKLYSTGVGGMTGSGKTWLATFLISQSAAAGAKLIVIDPHAGDAESLSNRIAGLSDAYMCDVSSTGAQIESALKLAANKLEVRRQGRGGSWPLLLICDEWTSLLRGRLGDLLTATALDYAEEGRKFGCFGMFCAQAWQVDAAGPVRDRLASHYTMRTRGDQFRYQMGLRGSAPLDTMFLKPGEAYFLPTTGDLTKVVIPRMEPGDITRIGALIAQPAAAVGAPFGFHRSQVLASTAQAPEANGKPMGSQPEAKIEVASTAVGSRKAISPEAAALRAELLAGKTVSEAARERNGGTASGRSYQQALDTVNNLLREMLEGE